MKTYANLAELATFISVLAKSSYLTQTKMSLSKSIQHYRIT